jgi:cell wall-associated NlpC family hydrolase
MGIMRNIRRGALIIVICGAAALSACSGGGRQGTTTGPGDIEDRGDRAARGKEAVRVAAAYIGTPYRSGGTTEKGVDCSGLTFTVYRQIGVRLPRTSSDQARVGVAIDLDDLSPGDLLFFGKGSTVTHVGIYAGKGEFIHASTRARSVRYDRLDNKYFKNRYLSARRVL